MTAWPGERCSPLTSVAKVSTHDTRLLGSRGLSIVGVQGALFTITTRGCDLGEGREIIWNYTPCVSR